MSFNAVQISYYPMPIPSSSLPPPSPGLPLPPLDLCPPEPVVHRKPAPGSRTLDNLFLAGQAEDDSTSPPIELCFVRRLKGKGKRGKGKRKSPAQAVAGLRGTSTGTHTGARLHKGPNVRHA